VTASPQTFLMDVLRFSLPADMKRLKQVLAEKQAEIV
jgi:hypothetical protein